MQKHVAMVVAFTLTAGGFSIALAQDTGAGNQNQSTVDKIQQDAKDGATKVGQGVHDTAVKAGLATADEASAKMTPHAAEIHKALSKVSEDAMSKGGFTDVSDHFVKADRDRLDQNKDALKSDDTTDGRVAELQKDWKAKYDQKFDIKDEDKVLNMSFASIDENAATDKARTAAGTVAPDNNAANNTANNTPAPSDANADQIKANMDRDTATVHIPASHGLPALDVPMVHETTGWRIDIPDSVDSAKLKSNLQTALTDIDEKKDQWPADADDAYRMVTHRVLLAIFDKPATESGAAAPGKP